MEIKNRICCAAENLFMRFGIRSISMDDIARQLGMSKKTIYSHFKDKNEMVEEVLKNHIEHDKQSWLQLWDHIESPLEQMFKAVVTFKREFTMVNPLLLYDLQKYHPKAWSLMNDFKNDFMRKTLTEQLQNSQKEGMVRTDINIEILIIMRLETVYMGFDHSIYPPNKFPLSEVQFTLIDHFVRGCLTKEGINRWEHFHEQYNLNPDAFHLDGCPSRI